MKCTDSNGIQSSSPIYTLNVSSAEGCTPEYANTTWTEWINLTCASNQMNQSRNKTQYDINDCGYENETFFEYQLVNDWQNTSWTDWYNVSSCYANNTILQERNLTNYDSYGCGENFSSFEWQEGVCTYPTPLINFTFPTPNNNTGALMVNMTINVSSNESLREVFVNFNKTLSLWMKLNNETGENATFVKDYSGYGNNGTILDSSNTEFNNSGYFGAGLSLNGNTNKYVNVTDSDSLDLNGNFTISIWVKQNSISPLNQGLLRKKTNISGSTGYWIGMNDGYPLGTPYFILEEPNHRAISKWNGVNISDGNWHNLIVVYNAGKNFTFYNNGVLTNTYSSVLPTDASNSLSLRIGQGTSVFNGTIDEIIIMKRAMSSSEILSLYNATANKYINEFRLLTGNYSYIAYGQMTNGTVESTEERTIYTNNLYPYFTTAPSNANYYVGVNISEQFTAEDFSGIANYSVNDSRFNISSNGTLTNNQIIIAGTTLLNITATNNIGNSNYTILSLLISDRDYPPIIEVSSPYQREVKTNPLVNVTLSIDEPLLDTCWYQVDSTNTTFPCSSVLTINYFNFTHNFTSIGEKVLTIFANNTIGLQGNKEIHFKVLDNICYKNVTINGVHVYYDDCNTTLQNKLIYNFTGTSSWINMSNYEYLSPPSNDWYVSFWMNPSVIEAGTKYVFRKLNTTA